MTLIKVLEINNVSLRSDIHSAISSSKDQFIATQQTTMKPQLLFGAKWATDNINEDEKVLRMGWASLGKRTLGAAVLGMFILTDKRLIFVRDDTSGGAAKCGKVPIQIYEKSKITNVNKSGILALKTIRFEVDGQEVKWERMLGDNADFILKELGQ
jgi:hypothetical protein